ncbi:winged helix-turn-helix domain-containing protein [Effusibacillus lacus]|nr:winged helix-turn-helix domain-containing protein [Effusibacillus lacus]
MFVSENVHLVKLVGNTLKGHDLEIVHLRNGKQILSTLQQDADWLAIVIDFPKPMENDFLCWKEIREHTCIPVMILSSEQSSPDGIMARQQATLELSEPLVEVLEKIRLTEDNYLRSKFGDSVTLAENVVFEIAQCCIVRNGQVYSLTKREFQILSVLLQNAGMLLSAQELLDRVWKNQQNVNLGNVYVYIRKLREKLEDDPRNPQILITERKKNETGFVLRMIVKKNEP